MIIFICGCVCTIGILFAYHDYKCNNTYIEWFKQMPPKDKKGVICQS